ncbi:MAG: glycosyltransferase family 39 protein [Chloroflexota bacterium]
MILRQVRVNIEGKAARARRWLGKHPVPAWLIITGGIILRLRQYAEYLSMGNDEAALARNIGARSFVGLTQPLDYRQGAPILFLFIEKAFILVFGNRDFVLGLFPLMSGLLALFIFYRIVDRSFGWAGLLALYAFAFSRQLINYSSVQKQYSSDVLMAVLLIHLYSRCVDRKARTRDFALMGISGAVGIWVSHPSALVFPGIAMVLAFGAWKRKDARALRWSLAVGTVWAASLAANFVLSLRILAADPYFESYWLHAFMPWPPWSNPGWYLETYRSLLYMSINRTDLGFAWGWFIFTLLGALSLLVRKKTLAWVLLLPLIVSLAASALHMYPLRFRLLLFLLPVVYLLLAEGFHRVFLVAARLRPVPALPVYAALCLGMLWPTLVDAKRTLFSPVRLYDMRAIVQSVQQNWEAGDGILVSGGGETFAYYAESFGLKTGMTIIDTNHRIVRYGAYQEYLDRLSTNQRVWVIFAHFEEDPSYTRYSDYLRKQGSIERQLHVGYARAYLWRPKQWLLGTMTTE